MGTKLNLSDVEVRDYSPMPAGLYHVIVTDWEPRPAGPEAKSPGTYYVNLEMTVQDGPYEDRKCWTNVNLQPQALFTLKGIAQSVDGLEDKIDGLEGNDEDLEDLAQAVGAALEGAEFCVGLSKRKGRDNPEPSYFKPANAENLAKCAKGAKVAAGATSSGGGGDTSLLP
jgi:hypothetical protein